MYQMITFSEPIRIDTDCDYATIVIVIDGKENVVVITPQGLLNAIQAAGKLVK